MDSLQEIYIEDLPTGSRSKNSSIEEFFVPAQRPPIGSTEYTAIGADGPLPLVFRITLERNSGNAASRAQTNHAYYSCSMRLISRI